MADFTKSLHGVDPLSVRNTDNLHREHCVKIAAYSNKNCRRRNILKMRKTERTTEWQTRRQTRRLTIRVAIKLAIQ